MEFLPPVGPPILQLFPLRPFEWHRDVWGVRKVHVAIIDDPDVNGTPVKYPLSVRTLISVQRAQFVVASDERAVTYSTEEEVRRRRWRKDGKGIEFEGTRELGTSTGFPTGVGLLPWIYPGVRHQVGKFNIDALHENYNYLSYNNDS